MSEAPDNTLGEAIEEAQRQAVGDQRWKAHLELHDLAAKLRSEDNDRRWSSHGKFHEDLGDSIDKALAAVDREQEGHVRAHADAHKAHDREHVLNEKQADARVTGHDKEHRLESDARDKAEHSIDKRLEGMNEVRSQLKEQALTFARIEVVNSLTDRIIAIEKGDFGDKSRSIGQGAVVSIIVGSIGVVGTLIGIVVVLANVLTSSSP